MSNLLHIVTRRARRVVRQLLANSEEWLIHLYASSLSAGPKHFVRTLIDWMRLPIFLMLQGRQIKVHVYRCKGGSKVAYIGEGDWVPFLAHLLESDVQVAEKTERVALWRMLARVESLSQEADLVFVELNRLLIRWGSRGSQFRTLPWVRQVLDVSGQWEDVKNRLRRNTRATDLRRIRKYKYTYEVTTDDRAYEAFFHHMYQPYLSDRYRGRVILARPQALKEHFDHGVLLIVKREDEPVAGVVCRGSGETCFFLAIGVKDGDFKLVEEGAIAALYYFVILWAREQGYRRVDFGRSRAFLDDGVFRYKRKWGAKVVRDWWIHTEIGVRVIHWTPEICEFLAKHPFICSEHGQLKGAVLVDHALPVSRTELDQIEMKYGTPGLAGLVLQSPETSDPVMATSKGCEVRQPG